MHWKAINWTKSFLVKNYGDKRVTMKATEVGVYNLYIIRSNYQFPTLETLGIMGMSFACSDCRDCLGGRVLVMIGQWYSRQSLTNHYKKCFS